MNIDGTIFSSESVGIDMKILYISTVFPKEEENSTIYTDLAEEMVKCGHVVTVLVAEERKKTKHTTIGIERGCKIIRVKTGNMYDVNILEKGISIITLEFFLKRALIKYLRKESFDLILFEAPPVTLSNVVKCAKKIYNAPAFLMMKDIFPQNAVDIGIMKKGSLIHRFFLSKEKKLYQIADNIGCMSEGNRQYIAHHSNISVDKMSIFPNTKKIHEIPKKDILIREKYGIPLNKIVFVFGGNMGKPQGIKFLVDAIKKAQKIDDAYFVLVGRGTEKEYVKKQLADYSNVIIMDNLPREEYEKLISNCDVGIVSLDHRFTIPNYPSRILSYMEYGMPVLAATDKNTDFRDLIEKEAKCGYWCESNSTEKFYNLINDICKDVNREKFGLNGRKYIEKHFDVKYSVKLIEKLESNYVFYDQK